jgi:hypothetical protein
VWNSTPYDTDEYNQAANMGATTGDFSDNFEKAGSVEFASWSNMASKVTEVSRVSNGPGLGETATLSNGYRLVYDRNGVVTEQYDNTGKLVWSKNATTFNMKTEGYRVGSPHGPRQRGQWVGTNEGFTARVLEQSALHGGNATLSSY